MTAWTAPGTSGVDAVSTATPLALIAEGKLGELPNYMDMFLGNRAGSLGETCVAALLLGGIYLVVKRLFLRLSHSHILLWSLYFPQSWVRIL